MSAQTTGTEIDLQAIAGDARSAAIGIAYGPELIRFAESAVTRSDSLAAHRRQLHDAAGAKVLVDAAGVVANFQRMVRIADAMGIPVDNMTADLGRQVRRELRLERFASSRHSLGRESEGAYGSLQ